MAADVLCQSRRRLFFRVLQFVGSGAALRRPALDDAPLRSFTGSERRQRGRASHRRDSHGHRYRGERQRRLAIGHCSRERSAGTCVVCGVVHKSTSAGALTSQPGRARAEKAGRRRAVSRDRCSCSPPIGNWRSPTISKRCGRYVGCIQSEWRRGWQLGPAWLPPAMAIGA